MHILVNLLQLTSTSPNVQEKNYLRERFGGRTGELSSENRGM